MNMTGDFKKIFVGKRIKKLLFLLICLTMAAIMTVLAVFHYNSEKKKYYFSFLVTTSNIIDENETPMVMHTNYINAETMEKKNISHVEYTSQYPLSVYDKSNELVYYSARVVTEDSYGDQLFVYDIRKDTTTQLTTELYGINYIYPYGDYVYMIVAFLGTHYLTPVRYDKNSKTLTVFDKEGKWAFELMIMDACTGKIYATAVIDEEEEAAREKRNTTGEYCSPNYTVFEFGEDFSNPKPVFETKNQYIRRIAIRPDGKLFLTLGDDIAVFRPDYTSYIYDMKEDKLIETNDIDEIMHVSNIAAYTDDVNIIYFIGMSEDDETEIRGVYSYNFKTRVTELIAYPTEGYLNSFFVFAE